MKKNTAFLLVFLLGLTYLVFVNQSPRSEESMAINFDDITIPLIIQKSNEVSEFSYRAEIEGNPMQHKVWVKEEKARFEIMFLSDSGLPLDTHGLIIQDKDGNHVQYKINHNNSSTYSSGMSFSFFGGPSDQSYLSATMNLDPDKSNIIGQETVSKRPCIIVENQGTKVWVDARDFVPLRLEANAGRAIMEFKDFKVGSGSVKDKDLDVPDNAVIVNE